MEKFSFVVTYAPSKNKLAASFSLYKTAIVDYFCAAAKNITTKQIVITKIKNPP
ncbi:hypothetical protein Hanom_Chr14g01326591 [Helianthus anomalus]